MRILAICSKAPVTGGKGADGDTLISAHLLNHWAEEDEVTLAYWPEAGVTVDRRLREKLARVVELPWGAPGPPWQGLPDVTSRACRAALAELASLTAACDVAYLHNAAVFGVARTLARHSVPFVANEIDPLSLLWLDSARRERRFRYILRAIRSAHLELSTSRHAASVVVVNAEDARSLSRLLRRPVHPIPNGLTLAPPDLPEERNRHQMVFCGTLDYLPNIESLRMLAEQIVPRVRAMVPDASLHVAGRRPTAEVQRLCESAGVHLSTDVPSILHVLGAAQVAVYPGGFGRGMRNSVHEAVRVGTPVVSSRISARGLSAGRHLVITDDIARFAVTVATLLTNDEAWTRAHESAVQEGRCMGDWRKVSQSYRSHLESASQPICSRRN